jgi:hypothetical protein
MSTMSFSPIDNGKDVMFAARNNNPFKDANRHTVNSLSTATFGQKNQ